MILWGCWTLDTAWGGNGSSMFKEESVLEGQVDLVSPGCEQDAPTYSHNALYPKGTTCT